MVLKRVHSKNILCFQGYRIFIWLWIKLHFHSLQVLASQFCVPQRETNLSTVTLVSVIFCPRLKKIYSPFSIFNFTFYLSISDLQYYISFRCATYWFDIFIYYKMVIMIGLVTIYIFCTIYCTKLYYWLYSLFCTLHPHDLSIL